MPYISKRLSTLALVCMLNASPAMAADWSGFYVGINMSSNTVETDWTTTETRDGDGDVFTPTSDPQASLESTEIGSGFIIGYNWSIGSNWLFGVEGSTGHSNHEDSIDGRIPGLGDPNSDSTSFVEVKTETDGLALRARAGYLLTSDLLLYGTFGKTSLELEITSTCTTDTTVCAGNEAYRNTGSGNANAIGVGVEYAINNFVLRLQYSDANFSDSNSFTALPNVSGFSLGADAEVDFAVSFVQLGLCYDF
jgi:outer membrane immunogenic protein